MGVHDPQPLTRLAARVQARTARGLVCFTVDDGYKAHYDFLYPLMKTYGGRFSLAIDTDRVGNSDRVTSAQLAEMTAAGNEAVFHSKTHAHMSSLTAAQRVAEWNALATLQAWVAPAPVTSFIYPYSIAGYDAATQNEAYSRFDRTLIGDTAPFIVPLDKRYEHGHLYGRYSWADGTSGRQDTLLKLIDMAAARPIVVIVYTHDINSSGAGAVLAQAKVTQAVQRCDTMGVPMVTLAEALPAWGPIPDSGFEESSYAKHWDTASTPDATALTYGNATDTPFTGLEGTKSGTIAVTDAAYTGILWSRSNIPCLPARRYTLDGFARVVRTSGSGGGDFLIAEYDVTGTLIATAASTTAAATASYEQLSASGVTDPRTAYVKVGCRVSAMVGTGYFDHLRWTPGVVT